MESTVDNIVVDTNDKDDAKIEVEATKPPKKRKKIVSYAKWGYIFILPFFITYAIFTLWPQIQTIYFSFFKYFEEGMNTYGPEFIGFQNYVDLLNFGGSMIVWKCLWNTIIMWVMGAVVQLGLSLLLAIFFTSTRLNLKCTGIFKSIFYMPNLIMASAFAFLFYSLFNTVGPVNQILQFFGITSSNIDFISTYKWSARGLIATMNFLLWFGNTTILLMAGIMGIDESVFESARIDGATSSRVFFTITMPLLKPIFVYVLITSMIGGLQMYDVPQIFTKGVGAPDNSTKTLVMLLNSYMSGNRNYGVAGAIAVILFIVTGLLSILVFRSVNRKD